MDDDFYQTIKEIKSELKLDSLIESTQSKPTLANKDEESKVGDEKMRKSNSTQSQHSSKIELHKFIADTTVFELKLISVVVIHDSQNQSRMFGR